jgi:hypothetical protein
MTDTHEFITLEVTRYMRATGLNQEAMSAAIGVQQSAFSKKMLGTRRWSLTDLDRLTAAGVPITLSATTLEKDAS